MGDDALDSFRYVSRIRAAIEDYEAGRMSYRQLREYIARTSAVPDPVAVSGERQ